MGLTHRVVTPSAWCVLPSSIHAKVNLRMTLCGGQCFHWYPTPRSTFIGAIDHQVFELRQVRVATLDVQHRKGDINSDNGSSPPPPPSPLPSSPSSAAKVAMDDASDSMRCCIEYRKLWPPTPYEVSAYSDATSGKRRTKACKSVTPVPQRTLPPDTDEELLARYLALDVDLAALWTRWTDAPTTRQHPLVTYLMSHNQNTSLASESELKPATAPSSSRHHNDAGSEAAAVYIPIRHVRQDVHSCLLSFLCSQNNNVTRITSMIYTLCRHYGDHLCDVQLETGAVRSPSLSNPSGSAAEAGESKKGRRQGKSGPQVGIIEQPVALISSQKRQDGSSGESAWLSIYSFPSLEQLAPATQDALRRLGFGYRSKYIVDAVKAIVDASASKSNVRSALTVIPPHLHQQHAMCLQQPFYADLLAHHGDLAYQRERLKSLCGVGRKVADCVLLFSLSHTHLVPVDTHMAQVAVEYLASSAAVPPSTKARTRKRSRDESTHSSRRDRVAIPWQQEMLLWGEKAKQLRAKAEKASLNRKNTKKTTPAKKKVPASAKNGAVESAKLPVPALYDRHHDAIQLGFSELFGPHAGWAHSILFYYRMRK